MSTDRLRDDEPRNTVQSALKSKPLRPPKLRKDSQNGHHATDGPYAFLADRIKREDHFARDRGGKLYVYQDGVYRPDGEKHVARRVQELSRTHALSWHPGLNSGVAQYLASEAPELWETPPENVLNLTNGLLDIETRALRTHTHEHLSSVQLPVAYEREATCQKWDAFIKQVFPPDAIVWGYRIPLWLIWVSRTVQKAVLLHGEHGCGKSTYLEAVIRFVGMRNITVKTLQQLAESRFSAADLYGKLANIKAELPGRTLRELDTFNSLVTYDTRDGERKFKDAFTFQPYAKLLFSANLAPPVTEGGALEAYANRWVVVPFPHRFRGAENERSQGELLDELSTPQELSGLLNRALDEFVSVRDTRLHQNTWAPSMRKAYATFMSQTAKLSVWLSYAIEQTGEPTDRIMKRELWEAHARYASQHHAVLLSQERFFTEVAAALPALKASESYATLPHDADDAQRKRASTYIGWRFTEAYQNDQLRDSN